jgi:putative hydrolase of the HAD superfamily
LKNKEHIFFDLDRTLWDFEKNSRETLFEIYNELKLDNLGIENFEEFIQKYIEVNDAYWQKYRENKITKQELRSVRFYETFKFFGINNNEIAQEAGNYYVHHSPLKTHLIQGSIDILEYLKKQYRLHIITNGFEEVQYIKLKNSGIQNYFEEIITSERAGVKKPDLRIFDFSIKSANASKNNAVMIGDDFQADILGAKQFGISAIWFNRGGKELHSVMDFDLQPDIQIHQLEELKNRF